MPGIVVLAQWKDDGKGKATDKLTTKTRSTPASASEATTPTTRSWWTAEVRDHLLPSVILTPDSHLGDRQRCRGSPEALFRELDAMLERGVAIGLLVASPTLDVIAPYHSTIDKVTERFLGKNKIGTTGRGIGPAYADKINGVGIRIADVFDEAILKDKVEAALEVKEPPADQGLQPGVPSASRRSSRTCAATPSDSSRWSRTPRCS